MPLLSASCDHWTCQVDPFIVSSKINVHIFCVGYNVNLPGFFCEPVAKGIRFKYVSKRFASLLIAYCTCHILPSSVFSFRNVHILVVGNNL